MQKIPIHKIQKLTVNKGDDVALVVEKIIDADAKEVVLNIPRFSKLAESLSNFHLIKREAGLLKKKIIIESVDDKIIELAGVAGLDSWNPILSRTKRQFADIVSNRKSREETEESNILKRKLVESVRERPIAGQGKRARRSRVRRAVWSTAAVIVVAGLVWLAAVTLPRADITLAMTRTDWTYNDAVVAQKLAAVDPKAATVPSQIFTEKQTMQLSYPASGKKSVAQKATGQVTVYNAYSSDPQPLVATTRLVAPDGKIFRLAKSVTVPGAKIVEGSIIPSTLAVDVVADQAGADYNIGPVSHFTIPGFKGSPKYSAFYAESGSPMTGGYVGLVAYPTDADLAKAKSDVAAKMKDVIRQKITAQIPADFKIIDGASSFSVLKQNVVAEPSGAGMFMIATDAQMTAIAFREADVLKMLTGKLEKDRGSDYGIRNFTLTYGVGRADFTGGKVSFPVNFKATIARNIDVDALREQVRGKSEADLRQIVYSIPSIQTIHVSLWPFWVHSVPKNPDKISITVD